MQKLKEQVQQRVDEISGELAKLADYIWEHPEYNFEEYQSSEAMANLLRQYGFEVQQGIGGIETSVKAVYDSQKPGPNIGILGEFDAVPGMGHACGHNLMCAMAVGAGEALRSIIDEAGGKVTVIGTPAEEGGGGKVIMLNNHAFDDLDVALLLHSANETVVNDISYSKTDITVDFYGKCAHAATWPEEGISALTPVLELFHMVNALKHEINNRGWMLGIITKGGESPIQIPDHCQVQFTIRSFSMKHKKELLNRFIEMCTHIADMTHTKMTYEVEKTPYEDIRNNQVLEDLLEKNFLALGEEVGTRKRELGIGCTDMGNVTHVIPGLQSYVKVVPELRGHTKAFEEACYSKEGHKAIEVGAKAMAMTAVDVLTSPQVLQAINQAFKEMKVQYE